jgi:PS-10 peptidase S37
VRSIVRRDLSLAVLAAAALLLDGCGGGKAPASPPPPARLAGSCTVAPLAIPAPNPALDLAVQLAALPGVTVVTESATPPAGTRFFILAFDRPVDHCAPSGARFQQRATLLWRSATAPTVLAATGYGIGTGAGQTELTIVLNANQVRMEHRYFGPSTPTVIDWRKLDIFQAATDEHQLVETLRPVLGGPWVTTGASKGGMTSVYHRAYYPDDVAATVAYVAPITYSREDARYVAWLESIGPPACRDAIHAAQVAILQGRAAVEPLLASAAAGAGDGYTALGLSRTLDFAALELQFTFWQYGGEAYCAGVPGPGATATDLFNFMEWVYGGTVYTWGDSVLAYFAPYYYQSATQLGYPALPQAHLLGTLGGTPLADVPQVYPPPGVTKTWDGTAMVEVDAWVRARGDRIMFIYGGRDPWSGGQYTPAPGGEKHVVPLANHGASIAMLPAAERDAAFATVRRWLGLPAAAMAPTLAARLAPITEGGEVDAGVLHARWPVR